MSGETSQEAGAAGRGEGAQAAPTDAPHPKRSRMDQQDASAAESPSTSSASPPQFKVPRHTHTSTPSRALSLPHRSLATRRSTCDRSGCGACCRWWHDGSVRAPPSSRCRIAPPRRPCSCPSARRVRRSPRVSVSSEQLSGEQESVATPQVARGWARPPCRNFKIQSCCCLGPLSSALRFLQNERSNRRWFLDSDWGH
jgi:hypothetical protein